MIEAWFDRQIAARKPPFRAQPTGTCFQAHRELSKGHSDENCQEEAEVLFDVGTSFRVLSFDDTMPDKEHGTDLDQAGRYRIVMEEM